MVSFVCESCNDVVKKPKSVVHYQRCGAPLTCIDCNKTMRVGEFQKHTTCISEAQKYEKTVWKGDKPTKAQKKAARQAGSGDAGTSSKNGEQAKSAAASSSDDKTVAPATENPVASVPFISHTVEVEPQPEEVEGRTAQPEQPTKDRKRKKRKHADTAEASTLDEKTGGAAPANATNGADVAETNDASASDNVDSSKTADATESDKQSRRKRSRQTRRANGAPKDETTEGQGKADESMADASAVQSNGADHSTSENVTTSINKVLADQLKAKSASISIQDLLQQANQNIEALKHLVVKQHKGKYVLSVSSA